MDSRSWIKRVDLPDALMAGRPDCKVGKLSRIPRQRHTMPCAVQREGQPTLWEVWMAGDMLSQAAEWLHCVGLHSLRLWSRWLTHNVGCSRVHLSSGRVA